MRLALTIIRWALGLLLIFCATTLYEDQEGKIQSSLEDIWIKVADRKKAALSRAAAFIGVVAASTGKLFDRLFGERLLSIQVVAVSFCFSIASFFGFSQIGALVKHQTASVSFTAWGWFLFYLALGFTPVLTNLAATGALWLWKLTVFGTILFPLFQIADLILKVRGAKPALHMLESIALLFGVSLVCSVLFVAVTRKLLRMAATSQHAFTMAGIIALDIALGLLLFYGPALLGVALIVRSRATVLSLMVLLASALNVIDIVLCFVVVLFMLAMLLHRVLWPILDRLIYAAHRYSVIRNKKLLLVLGLALLVGPTGWLEFAKWLMEKIRL
jgi:hypothetical protein